MTRRSVVWAYEFEVVSLLFLFDSGRAYYDTDCY